MSNQHVATETSSADISVFTAPVDAHQSSSKFRSRRGIMLAGSSRSIERHENMHGVAVASRGTGHGAGENSKGSILAPSSKSS
jgi:hypothetical protein